MNKIWCIVFLICMYVLPARAIIYNEPFDSDLCQRGEAVRWAGACKCYDPSATEGRYCDQEAGSSCQTTKDCNENQYCSFWKNLPQGVCHTISYYPIKMYNGAKFQIILSGELMNHQTAKSFCDAVGGQIITRKDFGCQSAGVSCGRQDLLDDIRSEHMHIFFWLEENKKNSAYYIDMADGTIYTSDKSLASVTQALCIIKKGK